MTDTPQNPGLGVDSAGNPVVDPTKNVLNLVEAESRRQDDLRLAGEKLSNVKHQHAKELISLHSDYGDKLREAETKRLDAIRAVDVAAAAVAQQRIETTAATLRDLVASTASAAATAAASITNSLAERIAQLERTSYEGSGRGAGMEKFWGWIVGGGALVWAILSSAGKL